MSALIRQEGRDQFRPGALQHLPREGTCDGCSMGGMTVSASLVGLSWVTVQDL